MTNRVAVNGFGRIGRLFVRAAIARESPLEIVAVNDVNDASMLAYLLEYDTVHGRLGDVFLVDDHLQVGRHCPEILRERDPDKLPWDRFQPDVVIEATGRLTMRDEAAGHLRAGAGTVIISAPATGADLTVCVGVNDDQYDPARHRVLSNASCTTNCLASLAFVLHRRFGITAGFMTTVHAYTNDQNLLDLPHRGHTRDLRRARAAGQNIVPSTTGAARSIGAVIPELDGRLEGVAVRVPVADGSLTDLVCHLERPATVDDVVQAFAEAAEEPRFAGVLAVTAAPLVSSDIVGDAHSCIFSACDTVASGDHVKVFGWYDNEWAYANRLVDLAELVAGCGPTRGTLTSTVVPAPSVEATRMAAPISSARSRIPTIP